MKGSTMATEVQEVAPTEDENWERIAAMRTEGDAPEPEDAEPEEEPEVEEPEPEAEAEPEPVVAADEDKKEADVDPWAAVPENLRQEYQEAQTNRDRLGGRVSGLQKKINALEAQLQANAQPAPTVSTDTTHNDRLDAMQEFFPEVADPLRDIFAEQRQQTESLQQEIASLKSYNAAQVVDSQEAAVRQAIPDFDTIAADPGFKEWVESQPAAIQQIYTRNYNAIVDAGETAFLLNTYKVTAGIQDHVDPEPQPAPQINGRRARQIAAATVPKSRTARQAPSSDEIPVEASDEQRWAAMVRKRERMRNS
jgi:hypothetical protein